MRGTSLLNDLSVLPHGVRAALDQHPAHYIDGAWHAADTVIPVIDPSSAQVVSQIGRGGAVEVDLAVRAAQKALKSKAWTEIGPLGRERLINRLADLIEANLDTIAQLETVDNGMPIWLASHLNVAGSLGIYRYFAGWPSKLTGDTMPVNGPPGAGEFFAYTRREPVGVVGAIVPWNVPFMMAAWKIAPALAAGCTVVLKPSEESSLSALFLAKLAGEAGFPKGVLNIVTGTGAEVGEALVTHPGVAKISFTGSTVTGKRVGRLAGENLKRVTLELGGKSPTIIFADANLDDAVTGAANSIFFNSGQICVAGSRLYVEDKAHNEVLDRLHQHTSKLVVGAGLAADSFMGPLINARQKTQVDGYIARAKTRGQDVFVSGDLGETAGYYVSPTVIAGAAHDDPLTQEEVFGPVLSVYKFSDLDELIAAANGTTYGLAASVFSQNFDKIMKLTAELECGKVSINNAGFPYPGLPEGGYKGSGYGRDLGREAVEQCLQTKSVLIKTGA